MEHCFKTKVSNLWLSCATAAAPFGVENQQEEANNMEIHFKCYDPI